MSDKRDWRNFFTIEDMDVTCMGNGIAHGISVNQANVILREALNAAPELYQRKLTSLFVYHPRGKEPRSLKTGKIKDYSHKGRVVALEPL